MKFPCCWLGLLALITSVGCTSTDSRFYDVAVANNTDGEITAWITKAPDIHTRGGPFEAKWASPEEMQQEDAHAQDLATRTVIPAHRRAEVKLDGDFYTGGDAYLRVYSFSTITQILGTDRGSVHRSDLVLVPGANVIDVLLDPSGQLVAVPAAKFGRSGP